MLQGNDVRVLEARVLVLEQELKRTSADLYTYMVLGTNKELADVDEPETISGQHSKAYWWNKYTDAQHHLDMAMESEQRLQQRIADLEATIEAERKVNERRVPLGDNIVMRCLYIVRRDDARYKITEEDAANMAKVPRLINAITLPQSRRVVYQLTEEGELVLNAYLDRLLGIGP